MSKIKRALDVVKDLRMLLSIKNVQKRRRNLSRLISTMILNFMGGKVRAVSGGD